MEMMRYYIEPRTRKYIKGLFIFCHFPENYLANVKTNNWVQE